jgi:hypothetical protein
VSIIKGNFCAFCALANRVLLLIMCLNVDNVVSPSMLHLFYISHLLTVLVHSVLPSRNNFKLYIVNTIKFALLGMSVVYQVCSVDIINVL